MPIIFIQQMSPFTVEVQDDDGNLVGKMTVALDEQTEDLDWEVEKAKGRPTEKFRMENGEIVLRTVDGGGPPREATRPPAS